MIDKKIKSFRRFNAFMDFVSVLIIGNFCLVIFLMISTAVGFQPNEKAIFVVSGMLLLVATALAVRQLYGNIGMRNIFREMTDEQYKEYMAQKNR